MVNKHIYIYIYKLVNSVDRDFCVTEFSVYANKLFSLSKKEVLMSM